MESTRNHLFVGFISSLAGHLLALALFFIAGAPNFTDLVKPVVYSVTLEGGKSLGGLSQLPKNEKDQPVAPPKNVTDPKEKPNTVNAEEVEVSLQERNKEEQERRKKELEKKLEEEKKKQEQSKKLAAKATPKAQPTKALSAAEINKRLQAAVQRYTGESTDAGNRGFGAGALGGVRMGGGQVRPPAFFIYRDLLKTHIKSGWRWFDTSAALICIVEFKIAADGQLSDINVIQASGNPEFDDSVLRAIAKANPVPSPPLDVYEQFFKEVTMRFDPRE